MAYRTCTLGLIPAHAGKTRKDDSMHPHMGAHPRSRGENLIVAVASRLAPGSSPLTRGKQTGGTQPLMRLGLIPAHAGKTVFGEDRYASVWAHPRSRGENVLPVDAEGPAAGSSPLTRGKLGQ